MSLPVSRGRSHPRKRYRSGAEDIDNQETRQKRIDRNINHVYRGPCSACLAFQGFRQGQIGSKSSERHMGARFASKICDVAICSNKTCWYFYHRLV
ncbi:Uncharacterized protein HZ326_28821 [Fusarium oxysporum f. sp. albedinis]|nr:Uncharacterized protein HZ326_28821 [Fusarium oxysporum f. sp. albedinis]